MAGELPGNKPLQVAQAAAAKKTSGAATGKKAVEPAPKAYTIAELYKQGDVLNGKKVVVHGRATKVTSGIVGKTWTHIEDGTGEPKGGKNDIISISAARGGEVGEEVTVTGTVAVNPDTKKVKLEDATFRK